MIILVAIAFGGTSEQNHTMGTNDDPWGPICGNPTACDITNGWDKDACDAKYNDAVYYYGLVGGACSAEIFTPGGCTPDQDNCPYQTTDSHCWYHCNSPVYIQGHVLMEEFNQYTLWIPHM